MLSQSEDSAKDKAQAKLEELPVKIGQIYTHYKAGGTYEIISLAVKEDTLEPLVIYQAIDHGNTVWARTYANWSEEVEYEGKTVKRFVQK